MPPIEDTWRMWPAALLAQERQRGLGDPQRAEQVGLDLVAGLGLAELLDHAELAVAGVVDDDVEAAEVLVRLLRRPRRPPSRSVTSSASGSSASPYFCDEVVEGARCRGRWRRRGRRARARRSAHSRPKPRDVPVMNQVLLLTVLSSSSTHGVRNVQVVVRAGYSGPAARPGRSRRRCPLRGSRIRRPSPPGIRWTGHDAMQPPPSLPQRGSLTRTSSLRGSVLRRDHHDTDSESTP